MKNKKSKKSAFRAYPNGDILGLWTRVHLEMSHELFMAHHHNHKYIAKQSSEFNPDEYLKSLIKCYKDYKSKKLNKMKQYFIFNPKFRKDHKSVFFTSGLTLEGIKKLELDVSSWNYQIYGDSECGLLDKLLGEELRPTKYESYGFIDLGNEFEWYPVYVLLGFESTPSSYILKHFMFGNIEICVNRVINEVGKPFLKLQGNTTRKVISLISESLVDLKSWIQEHDLRDKIMQLNPKFE